MELKCYHKLDGRPHTVSRTREAGGRRGLTLRVRGLPWCKYRRGSFQAASGFITACDIQLFSSPLSCAGTGTASVSESSGAGANSRWLSADACGPWGSRAAVRLPGPEGRTGTHPPFSRSAWVPLASLWPLPLWDRGLSVTSPWSAKMPFGKPEGVFKHTQQLCC